MRKKSLILKKKYFIFFISIFLIFVLFLNFVPSFAKILNKLAITSTKINLTKNPNIVRCFKEFNGAEVEFIDYFSKEEKKENKNLEEEEKKQEKIKGDEGVILRKQYEPLNTVNFINIGKTAYVKNSTKLPNNVVIKASSQKPAFNLETTNEPQVLIYHTHTTECYEKEETDRYNKNVPTRSKDTNINVVGVGQEIVKQLELRGIKTIHDTKIYDDPAYSGAYDRTNAMIVKNLKKYPKIKVVLDIHRDSIVNQNKERVAPVTKINGENVAQIMIISGCDNGTNHYKNYAKNLSFACFLEKQLEEEHPKITRPVAFKYKHYNQSLSPGALLIEVGSQANSKREAQLAGIYLGASLANALMKLKIETPTAKKWKKEF